MTTLGTDIETKARADLKKTGVHKYVECPEFEVILLSYNIDGGEVVKIDLANGEVIPQWLEDMYYDPNVLKTAFNAAFERAGLGRHFGRPMPAEQWQCTMIKGAMLGLPMTLENMAIVLNVEQQKQTGGRALITYFSKPCKPTKANGGRHWNLPHHDPERWESYGAYNQQDVRTETSILNKLANVSIPEMERQLWILDQKINDRGVRIDEQFVRRAMELDAQYKENLLQRAIELTGLYNPNSVVQIKAWLEEETGDEVETLNKKAMPELLKKYNSDTVKEVLQLRQELSKTSIKKYATMLHYICANGRMCGLFQLYGANRTGRWAGRGVQLHNLPQNKLKDKNFDLLDHARWLVLNGTLEDVLNMFNSVSDVLSQLIRTAIIPDEGNVFCVADFSAIEARVIAWLAGEKWRMDIFSSHGKIYEASAARMFKVPFEEIGEDSPLRQRGKVSELALGYQGGKNALITMGALEMGIPKKELPGMVKLWREENQQIVQLWYDVQDAAKEAIENPGRITVAGKCRFMVKKSVLYIMLPSGRRLSYIAPALKATEVIKVKFLQDYERWDADEISTLPLRQAEAFHALKLVEFKSDPFLRHSITYHGMNQTSKKWGVQDTYGGKLVENITQAIARDALASAMLAVDWAGYDIVMHVHDELVAEVLKEMAVKAMKEIDALMSLPLEWAPGLLLKVKCFLTEYYKKD